MKDYADSSILPKNEDSTGNGSAKKLQNRNSVLHAICGYLSAHGSTCFHMELYHGEKNGFKTKILLL